MASPRTDSEFIALADQALTHLGDAFDAMSADCDWTLADGILTLETDDGDTLVINRHVPNREIWLASPKGAAHFRLQGEVWRDTRSDDTLDEAVRRVCGQLMGEMPRL